MFLNVLYVVLLLVLIVFCWKTFDFFKMNLVRAATMSGFQYYVEKISFSLIIPIVIVAFTSDFVGKLYSLDRMEKSSGTQGETRQTTTITTTQPARIVQQQVEPTYTQEQVLEMENKVDYHGDDPMIRSRLGLPPKPASQY